MRAAQILISGGEIVGRVVDGSTGEPLPVTVAVAENGLKLKTDKTTGAFQMVLPAGRYTFSATAFGYVEQPGVAVEIAAHQQQRVDLKLVRAAGGTLSGRVLAAESGEGVAARIAILDTPLDPVATQAGGTFSLNLPAGTYAVQVAAYGHATTTFDGIVVAAGETVNREFELAHLPPILIVADDEKKGYEKYAKQALDALGRAYSVVDPAAIPITAEYLAQYQVIVWLTGDAYDTLTDDDQTALVAMLESGGALFISGQDMGYGLQADAFYEKCMHARYVADTAAARRSTGTAFWPCSRCISILPLPRSGRCVLTSRRR